MKKKRNWKNWIKKLAISPRPIRLKLYIVSNLIPIYRDDCAFCKTLYPLKTFFNFIINIFHNQQFSSSHHYVVLIGMSLQEEFCLMLCFLLVFIESFAILRALVLVTFLKLLNKWAKTQQRCLLSYLNGLLLNYSVLGSLIYDLKTNSVDSCWMLQNGQFCK